MAAAEGGACGGEQPQQLHALAAAPSLLALTAAPAAACVAAAPLAHAELERLRQEVHGFHVELAALQAALRDKEDALAHTAADADALRTAHDAAAARAEEATDAALHLERQLREAQEQLRASQAGEKDAAAQLAAAQAQLGGLQADQARGIRSEGELRVALGQAQETAAVARADADKAAAQLQEAAQREADAARCGKATSQGSYAVCACPEFVNGAIIACVHAPCRRIQQLQQRLEALEGELRTSASEAGQLLQQAGKRESAASALQVQLECAQARARELEAALLAADGRARDSSRQLAQLEQLCSEWQQRCEGLQQERQRLDAVAAAADVSAWCCTACVCLPACMHASCLVRCTDLLACVAACACVQSRAAAAERRAGELDSQLLLLSRSLHEAEAAALDWQARARAAEESRQELASLLGHNEAALKQVGS